MNYVRIYNTLIEKYKATKQKGYEGHHVLPKSMGGSDDKSNIVFIPCRVHFILHRCLYKIHKNKQMGYAILRMSAFSRYNSRQYTLSKQLMEEIHPLKKEENKAKISKCMRDNNPMLSKDARDSMAATKVGNKNRAKFTYEVTFPDGRTEIIKEMKPFCDKHNLSRGHMAQICNGKRKGSHKGFRAKKVNTTGSI